MEKFKVSFVANNQQLTATGTKHASDTYADIEATFALGERWTDMDTVSAVWWNGYTRIATVLDSEGKCTVPYEVLTRKGCVRVNLVGSVVEDGELVTRLTSYSAEAVHVNEKIKLTGNEPQTITPSQFEQFVENVKADADRAESAKESAQDASTSAQGYAQSASASASSASESATASEQSATASAGNAQRVEELVVEVEVMKNEAELARDEILGMSAEAVTLPAGSEATASYADGLLSLGIPRGNTGATGAKGDKGDTGATPNLTIGDVETLEPTESATATITGTAENPVLNLGIPQGQTGKVSLADLSTLLPTDTASGDIASFPDGQSIIPVESLKVTLEPIQDLNGYDKPWAGGAGVNKFGDYTVINGYMSGAGKMLGASDNRTYIIPIKASTQYSFKINRVVATGSTLNDDYQVGEFYNDTRPVIGEVGARLVASGYVNDVGTGTITTSANAKWLALKIANASKTDAEATASTIQVEVGSTVSTSWTPYSNIAPISGWTDVDTYRTGKNLLDNNGLSDYTTWESLGSSNYAKPLNLPKNTQVTISGQHTVPSGMNSYVYLQKFDGTDWQNIRTLWQANVSSMPYTFTTDDSAYRLWAYNPSASIATIDWMQIELGSTATDYEPYNGDTYTTDLGQTVYGGKLDVVSGVLTVDRAMVDLGTLTWRAIGLGTDYARFISSGINSTVKTPLDNATPTTAICEQYSAIGASYLPSNNGTFCVYTDGDIGIKDVSYADVASFETAMNGVQLVYELATPQTIQLTPQEVHALLGENNVWADSGEVSVTYKADVTKWVEKKLS